MTSLIGVAEYVVPFLIILTVLVFVHELGHYLVARYNKVTIEVFSIGFGPELFGWYDKAGTRWKFSLIPLGGYVRMYGDSDASSRPDSVALSKMTDVERANSLHSKSVGQRMAVSVAGPLANFFLAIFILTGLFIWKGEPFLPATIGTVVSGKIADKAGLKEGDKILSINNTLVKDFHELRNLIVGNHGKEIDVRFLRNDVEDHTRMKLVEVDAQGIEKPVSIIGITQPLPDYHRLSSIQALTHAIEKTWVTSVDTLAGIGQMIMGKRSAEELGGILSIGDMAGKSAKGGAAALLFFMAFLSINLGLINLLPIPVLDGGHILFYSIEAIRGKPVPEKIQEYAYLLGLLVVLGIMLMSTWNDVVRLILK